jgi:7,8-dihydropterin-6-yl-methyl-4-(beta-D-ribofuranosyl)aminobenzene 5'-phosphate synthase
LLVKVLPLDSLRLYILVEDYSGYGSRFLGQHGISILAVGRKGSEEIKVLFDTGTSALPIVKNAEMLNISFQGLDAIVLSHNHYDHTGGLVDLLKSSIKGEVPVIAHPDIFKVSYAVDPILRYIGPPPNPVKFRKDVEELGGLWILSKDPIKVHSDIFTTGEISEEEKLAFERNPTLRVMKVVEGRLAPDTINDEIGLAFNTSQGLVVLGGCSHPGIASIVRKAMRISGVDKVRAVIGGFHLIGASPERIDATVNEFKRLGVEEVFTGHCTGLDAEAKFKAAYGNKFHKLHAGLVIDF